MRNLAVVIVLLFATLGLCRANATWPPPEVERLVEELQESGGGSAEALLEDLLQLWQHPVNLRRMSVEQLRSLPLIAPGEAERIAQFLQENPQVRAVESIGIVLQMPPARRQLFAMFYTLDGALPPFDSTLRRRLRGDVVQRFGYKAPLFHAEPERMKKVYGNAVGSPLALFLRASAATQDGLAFGLKGVKQPGEPFFYSFAPQGFPYYSAYVQLQGRRYTAPKIVIGDFAAVFGTGQTVGNSFTFFRVQSPYAWGKQGTGIRGRLGSHDNSTLRGVALQQQPLRWLSYAVAISAQPLTTTLADGMKYPAQDGRIATIISNPKYTKQREADRHFNSWEFCALANVQATFGALSLGYSAIATHYNRDFVQYDTNSFRLPHPAQTHMRNGLSAHLYLNSWTLWGEITLASPLKGDNHRRAASGNLGVTYTPSYNLSIGAQGYYYPYHASARYAQGVISAPQNRAGAIANAMLRIADAVVLSAGGECIYYPNARVARNLPALSWRGFAEVQYIMAQGSSLEARYRYRQYQSVRSEKSYRNATAAGIHYARLRGDYKQGDWLSLRTSLLYAFRDGEEDDKGRHNWALAQDLRLYLLDQRLIFTCRGAIYQCLGEGVTMAVYEYAPLYSMATSRFSKYGWRAYGMVYWEFFRGWSVTCKAAATQLLGESLATLSELERQRRDMLELTLQLRWRF